jgi:lipid II:glycine glycyltransferase (peptidoglycan interpeptide bridge formation enzyme)
MTGSKPSIVDATDWPAERWDQLAVSSAAGHAYQSHAWGELKRPLGWTPRRFVVESEGQPIAAVSFQERSLGPRLPGPLGKRTFLYAPRGPVALGERDDRALARTAGAALAGVVDVGASLRAALVTLDPAWPVDGPLARTLAGAGFQPAAREIQVSRTAMIVPLFEEDDEQHRLVRKSTANLINRARREGATTERVDLAAGDADAREPALAEMHELLVATARREGIVLRDRDYQLAQWRALGEAGVASLWFAVVGGRRWAGSVLLRCGRTLMQYQAGSADDADMRRVPANHLLQWEVLRWAAANGFGGYDLGGVDAPGARGLPRDESHPLWNLAVFKRGFGAEGVEYVPAHERASSRLVGTFWRLARRLR